MVNEITKERLLQLGSALEEIMKELSAATSPPNPKTRRNKTKELAAERQANFANFLDSKKYKKRLS